MTIDDIAIDMGDDEYDPIIGIIEGAAEVGVQLTREEVMEALDQLELEPDEVSCNQPVITGRDAETGVYDLYKGGGREVKGWVTTDPNFAATYGNVKKRRVNYKGQITQRWSAVGDWDGNIQLVPPGPRLRLVYDKAYLLV